MWRWRSKHPSAGRESILDLAATLLCRPSLHFNFTLSEPPLTLLWISNHRLKLKVLLCLALVLKISPQALRVRMNLDRLRKRTWDLMQI